MSTSTIPAIDSLSTLTIPPFPVHRFTVEKYFELARQGHLGESDECELLEGWIVPKMVKNPLHDNTVDILLGLLNGILPSGWFVRVQNVLETPTSAPEPDFAVTRGKRGSYPNRHPQGSDVGLVIEVADTSLSIVRKKAVIYAAARVPEYWIVNLGVQCIEVLSHPTIGTDGALTYAAPRIFQGTDALDVDLDGKLAGQIPCEQVFSAT